ncbi:MAG: response regulator [Methylohalobius sp.]|nr:response regulator [Methylohalobius sp.]
MQIGVDSAKAVDSRRVFVVEEDEVTRTALEIMLCDEIETHTFSNLAAAYAKAERFKPDLLLLGLGVAKAQGNTVVTEIRSRLGPLKLVLVADSAADPLVQECLQAGADGVLHTPLTIEKTRRKVDLLLGRRANPGIPVLPVIL